MSHDPATHEVTRLLLAWNGGDDAASDRLMALVYDELRRLARSHLRRERGGHTLQPTALVHEAFLRLVGSEPQDWKSRAHFYGVAARVMRQVLVDHARSAAAAKRGGLAEKIPLADAGELAQGGEVDFAALDTALQELSRDYPRAGKVVELRFFGGMTALEIGEVLQVADRTVERDWEFARWWLNRALTRPVRQDAAP
jgi:RNA polymerase sigma-70 factor (ECF subfamily)